MVELLGLLAMSVAIKSMLQSSNLWRWTTWIKSTSHPKWGCDALPRRWRAGNAEEIPILETLARVPEQACQGRQSPLGLAYAQNGVFRGGGVIGDQRSDNSSRYNLIDGDPSGHRNAILSIARKLSKTGLKIFHDKAHLLRMRVFSPAERYPGDGLTGRS